jgi:PAS domain S-box-containing protein
MLESTLEVVQHPLLMLDERLRVLKVNRAFCRAFRTPPEQIVGKGLFDLPGFSGLTYLRLLLEKALAEAKPFEDWYTELDTPFERKLLRISAQPTPSGVMAALEDLTERRRIEQGLHERELLLQSLINTSTAGVMAFRAVRDETERIVDFEWRLVNPEAERIIGRSAESLLGKRLLEEMPGNHESGLFDQYVRVVETGDVFDQEHYYEHDGLKRWFHTTATKLFDGFAVTFRDITERMTAAEAIRQSEARIRAVLEAIPDAMFRLSRAGVYLEYFPRADFQPIAPPEALLGHSISDILPADIAPRLLEGIRQSLDNGQIVVMDYELLEAGGPRRYEARCVPLGSDEVLAIVRDMTLRKEREQAPLALQVERDRARLLEETMRATHHDLRNPIAVLTASTYLLHKYAEQLTEHLLRLHSQPESQAAGVAPLLAKMDESLLNIRKRSEALERATARLERMVGGLFELAKLDHSAHFRFAYHDPNRLVEGVVEAHLALAAEQGVALDCAPGEGLPLAYADDYELANALRKLVENAIQHTPKGGQVAVRSYALADGRLALEVQDTGIGITPADLPHIFERFYRADKSRRADTGGIGLGLTIARKIVEAHQGEIEVESAVDAGSTFRIVLPPR